MPLFDIFRKKPAPAPATPAPPPQPPGVPVDACTEDWRIRGRVVVEGRLLDALNRRDPLEIMMPEWAPIDGSTGFESVPGLRTIDPFDLLIVFARPETMPARTPEESAARRRSKDTFDVLVDLEPFQVAGTVHLYPGLDATSLLEHSTDLFAAFTGAIATIGGGQRVGPDEPTTILVNRSYLTHVEQVDEVTMRAILAARPSPSRVARAGPISTEPSPTELAAPASDPATPEPTASAPASAVGRAPGGTTSDSG